MCSSGSWIRETTRWALYLRDGLCCVYCGVTALELAFTGQGFLTLDHVVRGGGNAPSNLVTACYDCNNEKGVLTTRRWCALREWNYSAVRSRTFRARGRDHRLFIAAAELLLGHTPGIPQADLVRLMKWRARLRWAGPAEQGDWMRLDLQPCSRCGRVPDCDTLSEQQAREQVPF